LRSDAPEIKSKRESYLALLNKEIGEELKSTGSTDFARLQDLNPAAFDSTVYSEAISFLESLKKFYINRYNKADQEKEKKIMNMTSSPEKEKAFETYREGYHNEAITELVKNMTETHRIIEKDNRLIQKIYPIYKDPEPDHVVDFDAQFYMPAKHFLNKNLDTFYFNTGVIWSMTLVLAFLLYFDVLRRIIDGIGNLSNPLYRNR
jgi:hypothetical protein